jgi:hypothetical protein
MPSSQEVVVRGAALPLTEAAYKKFDQGRIDLLQKTVGGTAPLPTFYAFLELSARYDLDPLTGQIWLAQMPGRNGAAGRYAILVGRDGYLAVADRDPGFIDVDADVVYSKDEFRVTRKADGTRTVEHAYGNPSSAANASARTPSCAARASPTGTSTRRLTSTHATPRSRRGATATRWSSSARSATSRGSRTG